VKSCVFILAVHSDILRFLGGGRVPLRRGRFDGTGGMLTLGVL